MEVTGDETVQFTNGQVMVHHRCLVLWMDLIARNPKNAFGCVTNWAEVVDTEQNFGSEILSYE